jgi:hypothetical protein
MHRVCWMILLSLMVASLIAYEREKCVCCTRDPMQWIGTFGSGKWHHREKQDNLRWVQCTEGSGASDYSGNAGTCGGQQRRPPRPIDIAACVLRAESEGGGQ